jgi:hypothetical protein
MESFEESPPEKKKPGGKKTKYQPVIDKAKAHPGTSYRLEGEHHSSAMQTLKGHGLKVRSQRGEGKHTHVLWVTYEPS